jgi:PAS domain S-box-containing protein
VSLSHIRFSGSRFLPRPWVLDLCTVALAVAIFLGTYVMRSRLSNAVDADEMAPVALLALRFGRRGGVIGAIVAVALTGLWELGHADAAVTVFGYASRTVAFIVLGLLLGAFVDKRRRLEAELMRYFDTSLDLLATTNSDGRFIRVNPAWEHLLGYPAETMLATPLIEFVHPDDREATRTESALLMNTRDTVKFRNRYRAVDGSYRWLEWSAARARNGLTHAVARDITAQVQAEELIATHGTTLEANVAERIQEIEDARTDTLKRLALAGEYRDDETFQHTERVGKAASDIAFGVGLALEQTTLLCEAAPLHDIGKLSIPDGILLKPGPLTDQERAVMQGHTTAGERLLGGSRSPVLQMAAVIAASHHERWDGNGYPAGLAGEEIPLVGRIVAVADVFDALTHERPYKNAWPVDTAISEIRQGAGSQFDPRVVSAFLAIHGVAASSRVVRTDDLGAGQANAAGAPAAGPSSASAAPLRSIA